MPVKTALLCLSAIFASRDGRGGENDNKTQVFRKINELGMVNKAM